MSASALWTAYEAAAATGGALCARGPARNDANDWPAETWSARGLSIDTRTLKPGDIFVALKAQRDGHEFVESAFEAGASAALVSRAPEKTPDGAPLLLVGDTLEGLRDLARAARLRSYAKRIGVTGSAGKTSTKEMLRSALGAAGRAHAADRSFNNHLGVPLTLASLPITADYAVFEIGMNHPGEIAPLSGLVRPHAAIVTTVGAAHLEFFDSIAGIAHEKASIYGGLGPGGVAVAPIDNDWFSILADHATREGARLVTFGEDRRADYRLVSHKDAGGGAEVVAEIEGECIEFRLSMPGRHMALNALAAVAAAEAGGAPRAKLLKGLESHAAGAGRGAQFEVPVKGGTVRVIDESYNANPASMGAALAVLAGVKPKGRGRRIAVVGDMLELGPDAPALHAALAEDLKAAKVDRVYVAGKLVDHLWSALPEAMRGARANEAGALVEGLLRDLEPGDVLMAKGSNASRVGAIVTALRESDAATARAEAG